MKTIIALWLIFGCAVLARADVNLAVACDSPVSEGQARNGCTKVRYVRPVATTMVRCMASDTWCSLGKATGNIEVCTGDAPVNSLSDMISGAPCPSFGELPVASVPSGPVPVLTGTNFLPLTWMPPTTNTDGSPVTITGYRIYWGTLPDALAQVLEVGNVQSYELTKLPAGTVHVAITALSSGMESAKSAVLAVATKAPAAPVPNPPTGLKVQLSDLRAYDVVETSRNKPVLKLVGTVPVGTACVANEAAPAGMAVVDNAKLIRAAGITSTPTVIYARCS